ncbi:MAG: aldo/keto reductase, partial [Bacteroidota bacterium]
LAWLRAKPWVASVILGARTMAQLDDNLGAAALNLTPDEVAALDTASALPELYPSVMIDTYGQRTL